MALFQYKARDRRGAAVTGRIEAGSADTVASQLLNSGVTPISITAVAVQNDVLKDLRRRLGSDRPKLDDLLLFCRQMHTLARSGVPLIRGLAGLTESTRNYMLAEAMQRLRAELEGGRELSTAMAQNGTVFSPIMVSMIRVGEHTGRLDEAFLQLAHYLELERDTRDRIKAALRYPAFVLIFIAGAIALVNMFVIPAFATVFKGMKADLPWQTKALIGTSEFTVAYWPYLVTALVGLGFAVRGYVRTPDGRYQWDRLKLRLPLTGTIILRSTLARFARTFSMTTRAGVPLVQALTVVSRAVDNDYVAERVNSIRSGIERGDTLTRTAAATGLFTPLVLQMLAVGEETGAVEEMMDEVAGFYEREVDYDLKSISAAIEPILIVAVGILVLILALGIFLPMWEMYNIAQVR